MKDCGPGKAPGPNGFNFRFVSHFWELLEDDFIKFMGEFYENGKLTKGVNCTFLTLIPKVEGSPLLNDFRPISLVGCMYKIFAKVLANRLKKVLDDVVGEGLKLNHLS